MILCYFLNLFLCISPFFTLCLRFSFTYIFRTNCLHLVYILRITVDRDLLLRGESAVWTVRTGDREVLATAQSQRTVHLHLREGSAALLLMVAEAHKRDQAHQQRIGSRLNEMDQITAEAQRETIAGAL